MILISWGVVDILCPYLVKRHLEGGVQVKVRSTLVAVEPNGEIVVDIPGDDPQLLIMQQVDRFNGSQVEVLTVEWVEGDVVQVDDA